MATLRFIPQAWINDYAVTVDLEGPDTFQVPSEAVEGIESRTYESDTLRGHKNAPAWVREWQGPFEIIIEREGDEP